MTTSLDMTRGIYRRIYAGFLLGRRINSVSMEAEAWFWRLHALADDHGNLRGDTAYLKAYGLPLRDKPLAAVDALTGELVAAGLIYRYDAGGAPHLGVVGFEEMQPAGRNGRKIRKVPLPTNEVHPSIPIPNPNPIPMPTPIPTPRVGDPGESKIIQGDPGESKGIQAANSRPWSRTESVREIIAKFPACNSPPSPGSVHAALYALAGPGMDARYPSEADAAAWLLGRVRAWAASPLCLSTPPAYRGGGSAWFREAKYDTPDSAWAVAASKAVAEQEPETPAQKMVREFKAKKAQEAAR